MMCFLTDETLKDALLKCSREVNKEILIVFDNAKECCEFQKSVFDQYIHGVIKKEYNHGKLTILFNTFSRVSIVSIPHWRYVYKYDYVIANSSDILFHDSVKFDLINQIGRYKQKDFAEFNTSYLSMPNKKYENDIDYGAEELKAFLDSLAEHKEKIIT